MRLDRSAVCWGDPLDDAGQTSPPTTTFDGIDGELFANCGVQSDARINCWGSAVVDSNGVAVTTPPGQYASVALAWGFRCAVDLCGELTCWGAMSGAAPPAGPFVQVALGYQTGCGVRAAGDIDCWGDNTYGQLNHPAGTDFVQAAVGEFHACALRRNGSIACWGADFSNSNPARDHGQAVPPSGVFSFVATGSLHTCAIREDHTVACWGAGTVVGTCSGDADCGQSMPPTDTFDQIAAGLSNTCGIKTDGHLACWGSNTGNRSTPPTNFP